MPTNKYSEDHFNGVFTGKGQPGSASSICKLGGQVYNIGNYITPLKYATSKQIFSILDIHPNSSHLCAFGTQMSGTIFVNMWTNIAEYVIKNIPNHLYVMFELFNEPTDGKCDSLASADWISQYVIPAIDAIRKLEITLNSKKHIILATTYGNWSGVHSWIDDNTLQALATSLAKAGYNDSSNSKVLIAGHQYCDSNYSGLSTGCDSDSFSEENQNKWISETDNQLSSYNLNWIMTEGNIPCIINKDCPNAELWSNWLDKLVSSKTCVGFTVWYASSYNKSLNTMGGNTKRTNPTFQLYSSLSTTSDFYPTTNNAYNFTKWAKSKT